jgi:hypothetical protein
MNKKYLTLSLVVVFVIISFYFYKNRDLYPGAKLPSVVIELNEEGFTPKEVTILRGQSVTWKTTRDRQFWPASNLHPSHDIYPEFDPLEPIDPDKTWTFRFDKIGIWQFHDHLSPYYRGIINVVAK